MIRVLLIRETPANKSAGIDANCQGLVKLFQDDSDIRILPIIDYTKHSDPFMHQLWLDEKEISDSICKYNPDIVHIHGAYSFTLFTAVRCAKKYNKRIVLSPHHHPFYALRRPWLGKFFFHLVTRKALKYINLVFTINNEDTGIYSKYHNNVVRIPHWSKFKETSSFDKKIPNMILFVGRFDETNKGIEHLYYLPEGKYDIHCVGNGRIDLRSDMKSHINISDEELNKLYQQSSLMVVPSRYEAFSYAAVESLINNTPVLMSDRVRIADHLTGIQGYSVFRYHDYESFVEGVANTIGTRVEVEKVARVFDSNVIKDKYKKAYMSLVNYESHKML